MDPCAGGGVTLDVDPFHPDAPVYVGTNDGGRTVATTCPQHPDGEQGVDGSGPF
jgi:hypothetical protein